MQFALPFPCRVAPPPPPPIVLPSPSSSFLDNSRATIRKRRNYSSKRFEGITKIWRGSYFRSRGIRWKANCTSSCESPRDLIQIRSEGSRDEQIQDQRINYYFRCFDVFGSESVRKFPRWEINPHSIRKLSRVLSSAFDQ